MECSSRPFIPPRSLGAQLAPIPPSVDAFAGARLVMAAIPHAIENFLDTLGEKGCGAQRFCSYGRRAEPARMSSNLMVQGYVVADLRYRSMRQAPCASLGEPGAPLGQRRP